MCGERQVLADGEIVVIGRRQLQDIAHPGAVPILDPVQICAINVDSSLEDRKRQD